MASKRVQRTTEPEKLTKPRPTIEDMDGMLELLAEHEKRIARIEAILPKPQVGIPSPLHVEREGEGPQE